MAFWKNKPNEKSSTESKSPFSPIGSAAAAGTPKAVAPGTTSASSNAPAASPSGTPPAKNLEDKLAERFGKIRSALGPGTVIQGKLSFDSTVRIDGKLGGDLFSSKALIVGETGQVDAQVDAASLIILGSVKGKIKAAERIEVWAGGKLEAEVTTPILVVEEGAYLAGSCSMTPASSGSAPKVTSGK